MLGGNMKLLISGAAGLNQTIEERYRLLGLNLVQGYGLTETSPVVAVGTNKKYKLGSIGKTVPSVEAKLVDVNEDGIGELVVKGPSVMLGYYEDEEATEKSLKDGWFYTGDLAKIDEEGYIFICGRKKSVIVLKNGKNIFPEEMERLINKIDGVKESFIFGKYNVKR
ncbi:MAG: AMP-binding protein [Clostridia bacterium]